MNEYTVKTVTLEDNIEYAIIKQIDNYLYLANIIDPQDICIRKISNENGEKYIIPLQDDDEVMKAYSLFKKE